MFDTLQLAKDLEKDFTPTQAEALTRAFSRNVLGELATKDDIKELRAEIVQLEMRFEMKLTGEINVVRGEIKDLKIDIVRWIVGALLVNFFGVAGLMIALIKNIH